MKPKQPKAKAVSPKTSTAGRDLASIPLVSNPAAIKPDISLLRLDHDTGLEVGNCKKLVKFSDLIIKKLEICKFFDKFHGFQYFHYPATLLRAHSVQLAEDYLKASKGRKSDQRRVVLVGGPGSGRSIILAQVLAIGWHLQHVVVFISRGLL